MKKKSKITEIMEQFKTMEKRERFFELRVNDVKIWQYIRFYCYANILEETGIHGQAQSKVGESKKNLLRVFLRALKCRISMGPLSAKRKYDMLAFMQGKRKLRDDGLYWNVYLDPVVSEIPDKVLALEGVYGEGHKKPAKTKNIRYLDDVLVSGYLKSRLFPVKVGKAGEKAIQKIERSLRREFGTDVGIRREIMKRLSLRREFRKSIGKILDKYRPKVVLEVCYYGLVNMVLNEVCKERGIPTVEFQHGTMSPYHLAYDFPKGVGLTVFPDYLLSFGKYWEDNTKLPIKKEKIIEAGFPYLENEVRKYKKDEKSRKVLFISQGSIGRELSKIAAEFSKKSDFEVVYKLHPSEYSRWKREYPWLVETDVEVIDNDEVPIYRLFADSYAQVGVYSTAVYEGLAFGLKTFIVDLPGYEGLERLLKIAGITKVSGTGGLAKALGRKGQRDLDVGYFFRESAVENQKKSIMNILKKEESNTGTNG